jgi:hypothetical protein
LLDIKEGLTVKVKKADVKYAPTVKMEQQLPAVQGVHWRKDFKIYGQITETGGLSFVSLIRQLETGLEKGFSTSEIMEGIIRAIHPSVKLRSYFEGRPDLTLPTLRRIIRSHFQEKTPTELYQQLCNLAQGPKEEANDFLMRALDLRQKVVFSAKEIDEVPYNNTY